MSEKKNVMIKILSVRSEIDGSLFEDGDGELPEEDAIAESEPSGEAQEPMEVWMEGRLLLGKDRVELVYEEDELSGMKGSVSVIGFDRANPGLVSMIRSGFVNTALIFEEQARHICMYHTPFSEFEICVHSLSVSNRLLSEGMMELDYLIEFHGAQTERCRMTISIKECPEQLL